MVQGEQLCLRPRILETAGFYGLPLPSVGGDTDRDNSVKNNLLGGYWLTRISLPRVVELFVFINRNRKSLVIFYKKKLPNPISARLALTLRCLANGPHEVRMDQTSDALPLKPGKSICSDQPRLALIKYLCSSKRTNPRTINRYSALVCDFNVAETSRIVASFPLTLRNLICFKVYKYRYLSYSKFQVNVE